MASESGRRLDAVELIQKVRALTDPGLREAVLESLLRDANVAELALALDGVCLRCEQADPAAREVVQALCVVLSKPLESSVLARLREEAVGGGLPALERLLRLPSVPPPDDDDGRVPDYGAGRPLTLGERKALARRPDRFALERLARDPHPAVIERLLANPKLTEDDVLRMASRRPSTPAVLLSIARSARFVRSARIRLALVLNPQTPAEVAGPLVALLTRPELSLVLRSPSVARELRVLCSERLARRPPTSSDGGGPLQ